MAPVAPTPTYAPGAVAPSGSYVPTPASGAVPTPTPDPLSYYPTQPQTTSTGSGSATWTSVKSQTAGTKGGSLAAHSSSLAALWTN